MRRPWLFAGKTAPLYNQRWNGRRPELKYLTVEKREGGWGRSQRVGKCSQISDSQEPSPQREAIMVGRGVGRSGGACHQAYWQSVSKATGRRGGSFCPGTEKCLQEIGSLLSLGSSAMREMCGIGGGEGVNSWLDRRAAGPRGRNLKRLFCHRRDDPALGWIFECLLWDRWGDGLRYDGMSEWGRGMKGKHVRRCDSVFLEEIDPL